MTPEASHLVDCIYSFGGGFALGAIVMGVTLSKRMSRILRGSK